MEIFYKILLIACQDMPTIGDGYSLRGSRCPRGAENGQGLIVALIQFSWSEVFLNGGGQNFFDSYGFRRMIAHGDDLYLQLSGGSPNLLELITIAENNARLCNVVDFFDRLAIVGVI